MPPDEPTFSSTPDAATVQADLPPTPSQEWEDDEGTQQSVGLPFEPVEAETEHVQYIPIEAEEYGPDDEQEETETYDKLGLNGETAQMDHVPWADPALTSPDLPRRIPGPPINMDYFEAAEPPTSHEGASPLSAPEGDRAPTLPWGAEDFNVPTQPEAEDQLMRMPTQPEAKSSLPPLPGPPPIQRKSSLPPLPPSPGAPLPGPPPIQRKSSLPPLPASPGLPPGPPRKSSLPPLPPQPNPPPQPGPPRPGPPLRRHSSLPPLPSQPGSPTIPVPPGMPGMPEMPGMPDGPTSSQRVRALDRAISEVIAPQPQPGYEDIGDEPPTEAPLQRPPPPPTAPATLPVESDLDAPLSLEDSGIRVAIPHAPIEEVPMGGERPQAQPAPVVHAQVDATAEVLAPISRMPRRSAAGHGIALKERERVKVDLNWKLYLIIGGAALVAVTLTVIVVKLLAK